MLAVVIDHVLIARRSDAAGVTNRQALNAELKFGLHVASGLLDDFGRDGFRIGQRGLPQQNPFDHVLPRPFLCAGIDGGRMLVGHRFGKANAKRANFFADRFVLYDFVVDSEWQTAIVLNRDVIDSRLI